MSPYMCFTFAKTAPAVDSYWSILYEAFLPKQAVKNKIDNYIVLSMILRAHDKSYYIKGFIISFYSFVSALPRSFSLLQGKNAFEVTNTSI